MSQIRIIEIFREQIIIFVNGLIDKFPSEVELHIGLQYIECSSGKDLLETFVEFVLPHENKITNRDERVFEELKDTNYLSKIVSIWKDMNENDKIVMWQWFDRFVKISNKYLRIK